MIAELPLSAEQDLAVDRILHGAGHVILTGAAGAGKSTVIGALRRQGDVSVCATTARAALLIGGCTVDSMFAFSRSTWRHWSPGYLSHVMAGTPDVVVIDEASMVGKRMARLLHSVAARFGKRLVLVGDWAQARPVKDDWPFSTELFREADRIVLRECHRQAAGEYLDALNAVRRGVPHPLFAGRACDAPPSDDRYLRLFATNHRARAFNLDRLWAMPRTFPGVRLWARFSDRRPAATQAKRPRAERWIEDHLAASRLAHGEPVMPGARVVLTRNDPEKLWVNGDTGELVDILTRDGRATELPFDPPLDDAEVTALEIALDRTGGVVRVDRLTVEMPSAVGEPHGTARGFPVRLGWALTVHKAQGMTVERAYVDAASIASFPADGRHGLAYVGLSRTRDADGLLVGGWTPAAVRCDPEVLPWVE